MFFSFLEYKLGWSSEASNLFVHSKMFLNWWKFITDHRQLVVSPTIGFPSSEQNPRLLRHFYLRINIRNLVRHASLSFTYVYQLLMISLVLLRKRWLIYLSFSEKSNINWFVRIREMMWAANYWPRLPNLMVDWISVEKNKRYQHKKQMSWHQSMTSTSWYI